MLKESFKDESNPGQHILDDDDPDRKCNEELTSETMKLFHELQENQFCDRLAILSSISSLIAANGISISDPLCYATIFDCFRSDDIRERNFSLEIICGLIQNSNYIEKFVYEQDLIDNLLEMFQNSNNDSFKLSILKIFLHLCLSQGDVYSYIMKKGVGSLFIQIFYSYSNEYIKSNMNSHQNYLSFSVEGLKQLVKYHDEELDVDLIHQIQLIFVYIIEQRDIFGFLVDDAFDGIKYLLILNKWPTERMENNSVYDDFLRIIFDILGNNIVEYLGNAFLCLGHLLTYQGSEIILNNIDINNLINRFITTENDDDANNGFFFFISNILDLIDSKSGTQLFFDETFIQYCFNTFESSPFNVKKSISIFLFNLMTLSTYQQIQPIINSEIMLHIIEHTETKHNSIVKAFLDFVERIINEPQFDTSCDFFQANILGALEHISDKYQEAEDLINEYSIN